MWNTGLAVQNKKVKKKIFLLYGISLYQSVALHLTYNSLNRHSIAFAVLLLAHCACVRECFMTHTDINCAYVHNFTYNGLFGTFVSD